MKSRIYHTITTLLSLILLCLAFAGCQNQTPAGASSSTKSQEYETSQENTAARNQEGTDSGKGKAAALDPEGVYTSKDDVAAYLIEYGRLPGNFITKKEARKLGWPGGYLEPYAPGKCIGGDHFGNYEGLLPEDDDVTYYECDIDTLGAHSRGAKRIIYSDDGHIYYTKDHYNTFTQLY